MTSAHDAMRTTLDRRTLLKAGLAASTGPFFHRLAEAAPQRERILVILELSGGNDGLNTVVPYTDDIYHRLRPHLAIGAKQVLKLDDRFGFNPGMAGLERLYKDGRVAIVHGCGYAQPNYSHFASMAYWHTAAPNSGEEYGWVGRLADTLAPQAPANYLVNVGTTQSLAVRSRKHVPVVFDDPEKFVRQRFYEEGELIDRTDAEAATSSNPSRRFLDSIARSARESSVLVREACAKYRTPVDYGLLPVDLPKVAALIAADLPTRLYYVAYRYNAFDTHVQQAELHQRLLTYVSDSIAGFMRDLERIGRADDVVLMAFSEFGRRVPENANLGTDHGSAGPMFVIGKHVKGGHYGQPVDLARLAPDDNLVHTTDFRRTYATVAQGWLGLADTEPLLRGRFEPFPLFATKAA